MHESSTYHKWVEGGHHSLGWPEAELQESASVPPGYIPKISFPFILLLYDPIWQLHPLAGRISHCSVIKGTICLNWYSTVRHANMIFALNTTLIWYILRLFFMHAWVLCRCHFFLPGLLTSHVHYLDICSCFYA